jgi:hypothetical protein
MHSNYKNSDGLEVDHIVPRAVLIHQLLDKLYLLRKHRKYHFKIRKRFYEIANATYNLRTLCKECHNSVRTEQFDKHRFNGVIAQRNKQNSKFIKVRQQVYGEEYKDAEKNINQYHLVKMTKQRVKFKDKFGDWYDKYEFTDEATFYLFLWHEEYYGFILFMERVEKGKQELSPLLTNWYQTRLD